MFLKLKQKKNMKNIFLGFYFKTWKCTFLWINQFFISFYSAAKNGPNGIFDFFWCIFKNTDEKNICALIVFKAESKLKHEEKMLGGFSLKTKNALFGGSKKVVIKTKILNLYLCICFLK